MIYATLKLPKVIMTIRGDSFEAMMKDIGYLLGEFPHKVGESYTLTFISKKLFDLTMKVTKKNPKTKIVETKV